MTPDHTTQFEMFRLAHESLRKVLHNSADDEAFQQRADDFLEAVRRSVDNVHRLYQQKAS